MGKNLPIYTEFRNGGNQCFTLIKKVSGDCESLSKDLADFFAAESEVVDENKPKKALDTKKWRIKSEFGHIWINGNHSGLIRKFLESKGF